SRQQQGLTLPAGQAVTTLHNGMIQPFCQPPDEDGAAADFERVIAAVKNIETFHSAQTLPPVDVETQPGVRCQQVTHPVASVGLYI
ncbi:histidinol dehydrogenase, partial [Salmonella enterica subsp. enterica serovar Anatum]|nr:histidinol dehydrogenase [Salmonella enterica subsp. enterica serovar Anatum]